MRLGGLRFRGETDCLVRPRVKERHSRVAGEHDGKDVDSFVDEVVLYDAG